MKREGEDSVTDEGAPDGSEAFRADVLGFCLEVSEYLLYEATVGRSLAVFPDGVCGDNHVRFVLDSRRLMGRARQDQGDWLGFGMLDLWFGVSISDGSVRKGVRRGGNTSRGVVGISSGATSAAGWQNRQRDQEKEGEEGALSESDGKRYFEI